ncbi:MAG: energy transducer TonB [Bryobacteraceae bacterium]|nr:energy transducer TonB [Bryobacteraceae bacterium]
MSGTSLIYNPSTDVNGEAASARRTSAFQPGVAVDSEHLSRLAGVGIEPPWYEAFWQNVREFIAPPKQPALQVSSKPVQVKSIWGFSAGNERKASLITAGVHVGAVVLLFFFGAAHAVMQVEPKTTVTLLAPPEDIAPYLPQTPKPKPMGGGGGGGDRSPLPASKGKLPRLDVKQFVPPAAVVYNEAPRLVMEPTIVVPPDANVPQVNMNVWGDPLAKVGPPSNGTGSGGGIGSGSGGGVGSGRGPGFGPGEGGGIGGGVYRIGGGVTAPSLVFKVEPEYSEEARKAKYQGTVVLYVVVDEKGLPRDIKVVRALGLGLDEKAVEAVEKWRFRPGFLNGKAVAVAATVEVNFRLL